MSCGTPGLTCLLAEKANLEKEKKKKKGNRKQEKSKPDTFRSISQCQFLVYATVTLTTPLLQNINAGINLDFSILKLVPLLS